MDNIVKGEPEYMRIIREEVEREMAEAIDRYDVQNGAFGLVMNCKTGEILAMATLGSYDPNAYQEISDQDLAEADG